MTVTRIVLAEDHALVRAGIRLVLEQSPDCEVVGEAGDGTAAFALVRDLRPHVLLTDIDMDGTDGLTLAARVRSEFPAVKVVILSMYANEEYVIETLAHGVAGYVLKDAAADELDLALRTVLKGGTYFSPRVSRQVISAYVKRTREPAPPADPLTPRQREVLRQVAAGKSTKQIARHLRIGAKTAQAHRTAVMERLGIHDVAGLVRYAIREGMIDPVA